MNVMHRLEANEWARNGLFYSLIAVVVIGFNWDGFRLMLQTEPERFGITGLFYTLVYGLCFVHNRLLYQRFFRTRRYGWYALGCAALVAIWTLANVLDPMNNPLNLPNTLFSGLLLLLFGWGLQLIYQYAFLANRQLQGALYSSRNEVAQLRAQMNPHFLFNALNNLYGVSVSEPERVPDYVLMLSDMLRYQIQSSQQERVCLGDELHFLAQFIRFERLKLGHRGEIGWAADVPDPTGQIAPMLLFPFLENAVKYGCQLARPVICASLSVTKNCLLFTCKNTYSPPRRAEKAGTQTGLRNTRQRLALLYPHRHTLTIDETEGHFSVSLTLTLTPHAR